MAVTLFHRVIIINNKHIKIINGKKEPKNKAIKVSADIKTTRHTLTEVKK